MQYVSRRRWKEIAVSMLLLAVVLGIPRVFAAEDASPACDITEEAFCIGPRAEALIDPLEAATIPKLATPAWLAPVQPAAPEVRSVTYRIETRGTITADMTEFASFAAATLNDSRGWTRLGVRFDKVETGGDFVLVLSEASQMTTFSANGCDTTYSCNVGDFVIINQDRWFGGTPSWNNAGGNLTDYRRMVINHETGHWLGHGHTFCRTAGQPATVMQQQSMDMQGCTPNAWPLGSELYAPTLGIRS